MSIGCVLGRHSETVSDTADVAQGVQLLQMMIKCNKRQQFHDDSSAVELKARSTALYAVLNVFVINLLLLLA